MRSFYTKTIIISIFITLFLYIFRPFGSYASDAPAIALLYGTITFLGTNLSMLLMKWFVGKPYNKWKTKQRYVFGIFTLLIVGLLNWFPYSLSADLTYTIKSQLQILAYTFIVGMFPFYIWISIENRSLAKDLGAFLKRDNKLIFQSENKKEVFETEADKILAFKSEGNYVSIFYLTEEETKSVLLRTTLATIETQIRKFDRFVRCHRSYIINREKIKHATGSGNKWHLEIAGINEAVPVSRKHIAFAKSFQ